MILPHPHSHRISGPDRNVLHPESCTPPFLSLIIIFIEVHQDPECTQPNSHFLFHLLVIRNTSNNVDLITSLIVCAQTKSRSSRNAAILFHGRVLRGIGQDSVSKPVQKLLLEALLGVAVISRIWHKCSIIS